MEYFMSQSSEDVFALTKLEILLFCIKFGGMRVTYSYMGHSISQLQLKTKQNKKKRKIDAKQCTQRQNGGIVLH